MYFEYKCFGIAINDSYRFQLCSTVFWEISTTHIDYICICTTHSHAEFSFEAQCSQIYHISHNESNIRTSTSTTMIQLKCTIYEYVVPFNPSIMFINVQASSIIDCEIFVECSVCQNSIPLWKCESIMPIHFHIYEITSSSIWWRTQDFICFTGSNMPSSTLNIDKKIPHSILYVWDTQRDYAFGRFTISWYCELEMIPLASFYVENHNIYCTCNNRYRNRIIHVI